MGQHSLHGQRVNCTQKYIGFPSACWSLDSQAAVWRLALQTFARWLLSDELWKRYSPSGSRLETLHVPRAALDRFGNGSRPTNRDDPSPSQSQRADELAVGVSRFPDTQVRPILQEQATCMLIENGGSIGIWWRFWTF